MSLPTVRLCLFDAYGTLFDVHSPAARVRAFLGEDAQRISEVWRTRQLQYTWLRGLMGEYVDFSTVTAQALDFALEACGHAGDDELRDTLLAHYRRLDVFPEVPAVLRELRDAGIKTAILSNGDPQTLADLAFHAGIADLLDAILSVEAVQTFKPDPRVYTLGRDHFDIPVEHQTFQTSNGWDAHGAAAAGLRTVWVNRDGAPDERLPGAPDLVVESLASLPAAILHSGV